MKEILSKNKIEKEIEAFSIFSIYVTDFNDKESIMKHIDEIIKLYKNYNSVMFFIDPYFEELSKKYINGDNNLNTLIYNDIIKYCVSKLKVDKYDSNSYFCKKLYEYYEIVEMDKDVSDKTFNLIVNTYIHFANFNNMDRYILKRLLEGTNSIKRSTYINFMNKMGNILYNQELKKYHKNGKLSLVNNNDDDYCSKNIAEYIGIDNKILLSVKYLKQENIIFNLQTLFHEINHARQYNDKDYYDYEKNQILKEIFLKYVLNYSYHNNYWIFKHEYDAEYKALIDTINFVEKYDPSNNYLDSVVEVFGYKQNNLRIYDDELIHIEQLFDRTIKENITEFQENYDAFKLEYNNDGNRYLISHFIIQKSLTSDLKLIKFYDDLIYKHCYSYKEILVNIKDLLNMIKNDSSHVQEYKSVLWNLVNKKVIIQTGNEIKNIVYINKSKIKKLINKKKIKK